MLNGAVIPVIGGLAAGIGLVVLFGAALVPQPQEPDKPPSLPDRVWMGRSPTQCAEPWDSDEWRQSSDGNSKTAAMTRYLESTGVTIYEILVVENSEFDGQTLTIFDDIGRCEACNCLGWHTFFVLVPRGNVDQMQSIGFSVYRGDISQFETKLESALRMAESLNETSEFQKALENYNVSRQAVYITYNASENAVYTDGDQVYLQGLTRSVLPDKKPIIMVTYGARLDVENWAVLAVFIDPETNTVLHIHQHATTFG